MGILRKAWHYFSNLLLLYGYYLLFLFFYDTFLRVLPFGAFAVSLLLTLLIFGLNVAYWYRDKIFGRWKNA